MILRSLPMTDLVPGSTARRRGGWCGALRVVVAPALTDSTACCSAEGLRVNMGPSYSPGRFSVRAFDCGNRDATGAGATDDGGGQGRSAHLDAGNSGSTDSADACGSGSALLRLSASQEGRGRGAAQDFGSRAPKVLASWSCRDGL